MKKVVFVVLVMVFSFSLGRVSAKNDWECLYGNCNKDGFMITQKDGVFIMGEAVKEKSNSVTWKHAIFKDKDSQRYTYYVEKKAYVKMSTDSIAFGHIGENSNKKACIAKGYVFKLDLSSYDKYKDKGCEPLGEK